MVKPWKVTINGEVRIEEAGKASTAIDYAMTHYLMAHGGKAYNLGACHALDTATISIEPVIETKKEQVAKGKQLALLAKEGMQ